MEKRDLQKPDGRWMTLYSRRPIASDIVGTNPPHEPVTNKSHMRWHPLRGEWVAYAAHRQNRTFLPPKEYSPLAVTQPGGVPTELPQGDYDIAVFENLFPSLSEQGDESPALSVPTRSGKGHCEVVVFTQDPQASLGGLSLPEVELLIEVWADRTRLLGARDDIQFIMPFENRGVEVGVTLHHPHGQIYCYPFIPPIPLKMLEMQSQYFNENQKGLLESMVETEVKESQRLIHQEESSIAFIPPCARYPYETWIAPKRRVPWLHQLDKKEIRDLAKTLKTTLMKFDKLWNKTFPYLLILYQAPTDNQPHLESHVHFEIFPPLRTKDRLKFLAGTELGAGFFINDTLPEEKAAELRAVEVKID